MKNSLHSSIYNASAHANPPAPVFQDPGLYCKATSDGLGFRENCLDSLPKCETAFSTAADAKSRTPEQSAGTGTVARMLAVLALFFCPVVAATLILPLF